VYVRGRENVRAERICPSTTGGNVVKWDGMKLEKGGAPMEEIVKALSSLRIPLVVDEFELQALVSGALQKYEIEFVKEARLAPRCRVDFLCRGGIAVEVKRGKPQKTRLMEQLKRYAQLESVSAVILVVERTAELPKEVCGKPCRVVALNRLWGVAVG
jgi:hypothetical protein